MRSKLDSDIGSLTPWLVPSLSFCLFPSSLPLVYSFPFLTHYLIVVLEFHLLTLSFLPFPALARRVQFSTRFSAVDVG
ncbi:hypothetical protein F4801DRAFT_572336 [Xylaria longipes]|nr:hypothetical protein F4801DRAFT_572336 [Xylaria longipes]